MSSVLKKYVVLPVIVAMLISLWTPMMVYAKPEENTTESVEGALANPVLDVLQSSSFLLMEPSTGQVIYEKNADERKSPASITKIMTLLVIFDELAAGKIKLDDEVVTSAYAKSMGGSQVFLEEGEIQTVDTLLKCIAVASGNDACVAMAERIAGSEAEFVNKMNEFIANL